MTSRVQEWAWTKFDGGRAIFTSPGVLRASKDRRVSSIFRVFQAMKISKNPDNVLEFLRFFEPVLFMEFHGGFVVIEFALVATSTLNDLADRLTIADNWPGNPTVERIC